MAISIAYGIGFATVLTLVMLPIFLSFSNRVKQSTKWLATGDKITREEVERAIKEQREEVHLQGHLVDRLIEEHIPSSEKHQNLSPKELEGQQQ